MRKFLIGPACLAVVLFAQFATSLNSLAQSEFSPVQRRARTEASL